MRIIPNVHYAAPKAGSVRITSVATDRGIRLSRIIAMSAAALFKSKESIYQNGFPKHGKPFII